MADKPTPSGKQPGTNVEDFDAEKLPLHSSRLLYETQSYAAVSRWILFIFVAIILGAFLPWQQFVRGSGKVSALSPSDRPQSLPSRIDGRIERWFVSEGQYVARGTPIVQISEIADAYLDPQLVLRTQEQLDAERASNREKEAKARALDEQIDALTDVLVLKLEQAANRVTQLEAAFLQATLDDSIATDQLARRDSLFRSPLGLASLNDLQATRLRAQSANAALVQRKNELLNAQIELRSLEADNREKVEKARSDRAGTLAEVAKGDSEIAKLSNRVASLKVRQTFYTIEAPQDGYVVRAMAQGVGELVKAGAPIVTVQPARPRQAVELFVRAMDVPLLRPGRKVRLIFDGWPALQFAGWPSVAVGTFGGEVAVMDQVASADGRFRVLVVPDPDDEAWPVQLRVGSAVEGWAMLDEVRVWFEIWRQLNGFPPAIGAAQMAGAGDAPADNKGSMK